MIRSLEEQTPEFLNFLKSTAKRQSRMRGDGPVRYIPFGDSKLLTLDVLTIRNASLEACPATQPLATQLASMAATAQEIFFCISRVSSVPFRVLPTSPFP